MDTQRRTLIDIGVNLTHESFQHDLEAVLERAQAQGVDTLIVTGTDVTESRHALALAQRYPGRLYATAGVHPHDAKDFSADTLSELRELAQAGAVVAIGETGLDFNRNYSAPAQQEAAFEQQLELACELKLPLFLHERDAYPRLYEMVRYYRDELVDAVVHCFTGDRQALFAYLDLDLHIGITGWICDERRGQTLQRLVSNIPLERLMLETDAPYLLPRTLRPRPRTRRNEPAYLTAVLEQVSVCRACDPEQVAQATSATARRFFRLPELSTSSGAAGH